MFFKESMRNLYTAVEDDQEDYPTPRSPDSGSECNISERNGTIFGSINDDDFDDPTLLHSTPKPFVGVPPSTSNKFSYEEIDLDDPVSVHVMQRINSTSNAKSKQASTSSVNSDLKKKAYSSSGRNRFGSEGSASSISKRGETTNSSSNSGKNRTIRNPIPLNNGGVLLKSSGESNSNNAYKSNGKATTSAISSSSLASSSSNSRASTKKLVNSTMINSPLHLDPVT